MGWQICVKSPDVSVKKSFFPSIHRLASLPLALLAASFKALQWKDLQFSQFCGLKIMKYTSNSLNFASVSKLCLVAFHCFQYIYYTVVAKTTYREKLSIDN